MNFKKLINKLLDNKKFYYLILFLTIAHLFIYMMRRNYKAIGFFVLSAIIIFNFTKNRINILLISLIATHFFVWSQKVYEGLENNNDKKVKNEETIDKLKSKDIELGTAAEQLNKENVVSAKKDIVSAKKDIVSTKVNKIKDHNNPEMNEGDTSTDEPIPETFESGKKGTVRLDHAATIESAYDDLQNILGSDGISKLTDDTKKLMNQQKQLFSTMEALTPAVNETVSMLQGMDMKGITNISNAATDIQGKLKGLLGGNKVVASNSDTGVISKK